MQLTKKARECYSINGWSQNTIQVLNFITPKRTKISSKFFLLMTRICKGAKDYAPYHAGNMV